MASLSTTVFLIFNILFFSLIQGQETPPSPAMNSTTSPPPAMNSTTSPPPAMTSTTNTPPPGLDCSGCRVNPIGLASCGFVISGGVLPPLVRLCCKALQSLTREEGFACLCNFINQNALNAGSLNIRAIVDQTLNTCSNI